MYMAIKGLLQYFILQSMQLYEIARMAMETGSQVYSAFFEEFVNSRGHHKLINKVTNPKLEIPLLRDLPDKDKRKEAQFAMYGGVFISVLVRWEAFVQDFLEEVFLKVVEKITSEQHPRKQAAKLLEKAFEDLHSNSKQQPKTCAQKFGVKLALDPDAWKMILNDYAKKACKGCTPVFHGNNSITKYFKQLFLPYADADRGIDLAKEMLSQWNPNHPIQVGCIINTGEKLTKEPILDIDNQEALMTLTRLIYGVRCVLVHPKSEKTFVHGALEKFPDHSLFSQQMGRSEKLAVNQFYTFFQRAEAAQKAGDTSHLQIFYCDIVNLQRYILAIAARLHNTVVKLVEDEYGIKVWDLLPVRIPDF